MQALKQTDSRWKNIKLGTCDKDTIGSSGCFITCIAMLIDSTPDKVNQILTANGGYRDGCLLVTPVACSLFNLRNGGKVTANPSFFPCIAETDHYSKIVNGKQVGIPQHFFIDLGNGRILDSYDGQEKKNPYHIVSWRLLSPKQPVNLPEVTIEEDFQNCFITRATRFATEAEMAAWKASGQRPYEWVQQNAPDPVLAETKQQLSDALAREASLKDQLAHVPVGDPEATQQVGIIKAFIDLISKWFK